MNKEERLKDYLEGYETQYLYRNEDGTFHTLNDDLKELLEENTQLQRELEQKNNIIEEIREYVNFLVIFNQNINGKFSETQWGEDILGIIEELEKGSEYNE